MDAESFRRCGKEMVDIVADYLENIRDRPVLPSVSPGYIWDVVPDHAPQKGESWETICGDIEKVVMQGMTHWHSPRFHAYFPTANSFPAICADILSGGLACIGFTWASSPACTELEMAMMDWLAKMLDLPPVFLFSSGGHGGGVVQGTASEATLVALLSARSKTITTVKKRHGDQLEDAEIQGKLVAYTSEQSHSSVERAGMLGAVKTRLLKPDLNLSLRGDALRRAVAEDKAKGLIPFFVIATLGTTNTCAFDNLNELGIVAKENDLWLHVDAAYAGSAFICPEFRQPLAGIEYAQSFNMNPHKWMLVNFDCSAMWVQDRRDLVDAFNVNPQYLKHDQEGQIPDYRHWHIPLGRRFRSLKMWFVFRTYGVEGLQKFIRKQVELAKKFESLLKSDERFEIARPASMGLVCFRLKGSNELNENFLKSVNDRKIIHMVSTKIDGVFIIRFAVCARATNDDDIEFSWREIQHVIASDSLKSA